MKRIKNLEYSSKNQRQNYKTQNSASRTFLSCGYNWRLPTQTETGHDFYLTIEPTIKILVPKEEKSFHAKR